MSLHKRIARSLSKKPAERRLLEDRRWCADRRIEDLPIAPDREAIRRGGDRRSGIIRRQSDA
jgi:hypothetical protein